MRSKLTMALAVCLVMAVLLGVGAAAAPAKTFPSSTLSPASGVWTWDYVDDGFGWDSALDGWGFSYNDAERGVWAGTFEGTSVEPWCFYVDPDGDLWALITIHFRGKVDGRRGTADIALTVEIPNGSTEPMSGSWAVQSGTGGLKHLFGVGTWVEDVANGHGDYTGAYSLP